MSTPIRIGTRDSELALWQANHIRELLERLGHKTKLVPVKSTGDLVLDKPLYEMGITGIFTKTLDIALLQGKIDIAVHSMKDVPTQLPDGIVEAAILERASPYDVLVHKGLQFLDQEGAIATGSLRRKAQWLYKYPKHKISDLRGNVNTRMQKLNDSDWNGAIFAEAGLHRIDLTPKNSIRLDWMIPAPAQGALLVATQDNNVKCLEILKKIHHPETAYCVRLERDFLRRLEGGCTAPIGALATISENRVHFRGVLSTLDGTRQIFLEKSAAYAPNLEYGKAYAEEILQNGGVDMMKEIRLQLNSNHA